MKILLVVPTFRYTEGGALLSISDFPTGLAYISSALKKASHEVIGLNLNNDKKYDNPVLLLGNELSRAIEEEKPDLIGVGGLCVDFAFIRDAIETIRQVSAVPIVMGGRIITNDRDYIFNRLKPDFCIWGDGEETMVQLADMLEAQGHPSSIKNLGYWTEEGPVFNETDYNYGDIDTREFPDYEPFGIQSMMDDYSIATRILYRYTRPYPRPMTINTARGCPFNCTFCIHREGPKYRARSIANIMAEIEQLYDKYQFNILIIGDELFAADKKRFASFCKALIGKKKALGWDFDWMFQTHANSKLDLDSLELAKTAGCFFFSYGLESASPKVLKSMNKKSSVEDYLSGIELSKQVGIGFGGNLLFGDPIETNSTIEETLEFWARHCQDSMVFLAMLMPYPGCAVFDYCEANGIIPDKDEYYDTIGSTFFNMTKIPVEQFRSWAQFIMKLETTWMLAKDTKAISHLIEDTVISHSPDVSIHKIGSICPHCGDESTYREIWNKETEGPLWLGTACQKCNQRIKVRVG